MVRAVGIAMVVAVLASAPATAAVPAGTADLLQAGSVTVPLRMERGADAVVRVALASAEERIRLGRRRVRSLGPVRVRFPLSQRARGALLSCVPLRIEARTVFRGTGARPERFRRRVDLQPPLCGRFFAADSLWNRPLADDAPLDPNAHAITTSFLEEVERDYRSGLHPTINTTSYSAPVYTVPRGQRWVPVTIETARTQELKDALSRIPIPRGARPAPGSDGHLVVWQPSRDRMWELWRARREKDGWHAVYGGRLDHVSRDRGRYAGRRSQWGATASSLPLVGGLITLGELRRGRIDHALAIAIPRPRAGVFSLPAQRTDGTVRSRNAVPMGARFRLDPDLDLAALELPPAVHTIAEAAQRHGLIVRDRAGAVSFFAEDPAPYRIRDPYPWLFNGRRPRDLLRSFPWAHLQLMKMQLRRSPGSSADCPLLGCR